VSLEDQRLRYRVSKSATTNKEIAGTLLQPKAIDPQHVRYVRLDADAQEAEENSSGTEVAEEL